MTVAQLGIKAHLSERAVQAATAELSRLRLLSVTRVKGGNAYWLAMVDPVLDGADSAPLPAGKGAESAPPQILHPADSAPRARKKRQASGKHADSAPLEISDVLISSRGSEPVEVKETPAKPSPPPQPRPEVDRLCEHLADRIAANGSRRPAITRKWRDACRLLIDKDGRSPEQVKAAIDWSQSDEFWRVNILSMPTLRDKYDRLRLDAIRKQNAGQRNGNGRQPTEDEYNEVREIARRLDAQEEMQ